MHVVLGVWVLGLACYRGSGVADCAVQCGGDGDCSGGQTCDLGAGLCTSGPSCTGVGADADPDGPDGPEPMAAWKAVDVGGRFVCAISGAGRLYCWGDNGHGQLGGQPSEPVPAPREVQLDGSASGGTLDRWIAVSAGDHYACAIAALPAPAPADQGVLYCWGANEFAQAGGDAAFTPRPVVPVDPDKTDWRTVVASTGGTHTCAIDATGTASCWGNNTVGKVAPTRFAEMVVPYATASTWPGTVAIAGGPRSTCRTTDRDLLLCWGASAGEFGVGSCSTVGATALCNEFAPIPGVALTQVALGDNHGCASGTTLGTTRCWGDNGAGQQGDAVNDGAPRITELPLVAGLVAAGSSTCGLDDTGQVRCAGSNRWGELGDDRPLDSRRRRQASLPSAGTGLIAREVSVGGIGNYDATRASATVCAIDTSSRLRCWGDNDHGQLGRGRASSHPVAVEVMLPHDPTDGWTDVAVGATHTCAALGRGNDGARAVFCWGGNEKLQVGTDVVATTSVPRAVVALGDPPFDHHLAHSALASTRDHTCVTTMSERVLCWGDRSNGQFGSTGVTLPQALPLVDETLVGTQLAVGDRTTCVGSPSDALVRPGLCKPAVAEVPACYPSMGSAARDIALLADGYVAVTGLDGGSPLCSATACQGGGFCDEQGTGIYDLDPGDVHVCGVTGGGGSLMCWGDQEALDGTRAVGNVPLPAQAGTIFVDVVAGRATTCAVTSAGTVVCIGANHAGQVGLPARDTPQPYVDPAPVVALPADVCAIPGLALAERHGCVLTLPRIGGNCPVSYDNVVERRLFCWGSNAHGQLGPGVESSAGGAVPKLVLDPLPPL
jgi:alpha-tubulin suppressor-like RCC1 family protein